MIYQLTNEFRKLNEKSGTVQNSSVFTVELSNKKEFDSGILLFPRQYYSFSGETLYARCIEGTVKIRVVPFIVSQGSGGSSGGSSSSDTTHPDTTPPDTTPADVPDESIASDEQVNNILDDIFG